jgi:hypothetical protein
MKPPSRRQLTWGTAVCCALLSACSAEMGGPAQGGPDTTPTGGTTGGSTAQTGGAGGSTGGSGATGGVGGSSGSAGAAGAAGTGGSSGSAGSAGATGGSGGVLVVDPPPFEPAPGVLRRLTRAQFRNAVRDVFGVEVDVQQLDPDSWNGHFASIGAASVVTSERGVEQYHSAIEKAAETVFADSARRTAFIGCTPSSAAGDACVRGFVEAMGRRAWRRPLEVGEVDQLVAVAEQATTELGSASEGVRWATVAIFTSPNFLYRAELGAPETARYTGYETASRLAFLVWNSLADDALLDQAESGALGTAEGVRAAVERLLDAPAGRRSVSAFAEEYLRLDRIGTQAKDAALYPEYGPALQEAMIRDLRDVWEVVAFDDHSSALELFTTPKVIVNSTLATLYGLDTAGLAENTFEVRSLPADGPRGGILAKAGFLSQFANQKEGSPTLRGKFMRESLLCTAIDPPPGNIDIVLEDPPVDQPQTKRQRLEMHRTNATCAGCHSLMDPLGLPLETFDAIGRYRTTDHGLTIDPSGDFDGTAVANARELGVAAASSATVANCILRKYYTFAVGHEERSVDGSVLNALAASFEASGFKLRDLVLSVALHDAFASVAPQSE